MRKLLYSLICLTLTMPAIAGEGYVDKVNPFIDSHRSRWFFFDSASLPFGW